jgi:hypothetical protein
MFACIQREHFNSAVEYFLTNFTLHCSMLMKRRCYASAENSATTKLSPQQDLHIVNKQLTELRKEASNANGPISFQAEHFHSQ